MDKLSIATRGYGQTSAYRYLYLTILSKVPATFWSLKVLYSIFLENLSLSDNLIYFFSYLLSAFLTRL